MGFLFGMMIGGMVAGGSPSTTQTVMQALSQIPLRCFAAFDEGDGAYRRCRMVSLAEEVRRQVNNGPDYVTHAVSPEGVAREYELAMDYEIRALHELKDAMASKKAVKE